MGESGHEGEEMSKWASGWVSLRRSQEDSRCGCMSGVMEKERTGQGGHFVLSVFSNPVQREKEVGVECRGGRDGVHFAVAKKAAGVGFS